MSEDLEEHEIQRFAELLRFAGARTEVPEERLLRAREAVRRQWKRETRRRRARRVTTLGFAGLAAAASLLLVLRGPRPITESDLPPVLTQQIASIERSLGEVRIGRSSDLRQLSRAPLRVGDTLVTGLSGRVALRWLDGQSLRVDLDTTVRFISEEEIVLDRGAIYLDVDPSVSPARPVRIVTSLGTVRHVGTQFEVRMADRELSLRVREGVAELDLEGRSHRAEAGVEMVLGPEGVSRETTVSPFDPVWSWTQAIAPTFELEGETLAVFLEWIERETGWSVRLDQDLLESADKVVLHGAIDGMSPEEAVRAVLPTCQVRFRVQDGWLVVARL